MNEREFAKADFEEWEMPNEPPPGGRIVSDRITGVGRWSVRHELIFTMPDQDQGTAWRVTYSRGATESQEERPWQYEKTIKATLVREVERVVKVWEEVPRG